MKKKLLVFFLILMLTAADMFYWSHGLVLGRQLPGSGWDHAELYAHYDTEVELSEEDIAHLAVALENTRVTRRPQFKTMSRPWFHLVMQLPDGAPIILTVVENGNISVEPGTGKKQYYDNGEELYQVLMRFMTE